MFKAGVMHRKHYFFYILYINQWLRISHFLSKTIYSEFLLFCFVLCFVCLSVGFVLFFPMFFFHSARPWLLLFLFRLSTVWRLEARGRLSRALKKKKEADKKKSAVKARALTHSTCRTLRTRTLALWASHFPSKPPEKKQTRNTGHLWIRISWKKSGYWFCFAVERSELFIRLLLMDRRMRWRKVELKQLRFCTSLFMKLTPWR